LDKKVIDVKKVAREASKDKSLPRELLQGWGE
jgi:hypothetical protein